MRERRFGVEIEFGLSGRNSRAGDLCIMEGTRPSWRLGHDGTYFELKSPILQGKEGFEELERVMNFINESDGYVTSSDGLHVHHDAPDYVRNIEAIVRLVRSWQNIRPYAQQLVALNRRNHDACPAWNPRDIDTLEMVYEKFRESPDGVVVDSYYGREYSVRDEPLHGIYSRSDLNVRSLVEHGTVEMRMLEGTLDYDRLEAWIMFGQAFLDRVAGMKRELAPVTSVEDMHKRLRVAKSVMQRLSPELVAA